MLLEAKGIYLTYQAKAGPNLVLDDVGISMAKGEAVGLIGMSGSGKSTLARVVVGLEAADRGTLSFDGVSCDASLAPFRRPRGFRKACLGMQMVFQHPASTFPPHMTVETAVAEGVAYRGMSRRDCASKAREALQLVGLDPAFAEKRAWELSGGQCQRAALARAIVSRPKLLICDEPTSSLDATVQAQIVHLIKGLCDELEMACLFISHDLALVRGLCSRAYVMDGGRVVEEGPCARLFEAPRAEATRRLLDAIIEL